MTDDSTTAADYGADTEYGAPAAYGDDYTTEVAPEEE